MRGSIAIFKKPGQEQVSLANFKIIKLLGKGAQAKVYLVKKDDDKKLYAMKVIRKDVILEEDMLKNIIEEKRILNDGNHPFMVHMNFMFQNDVRLFFVMDLVEGGELWDHLRE